MERQRRSFAEEYKRQAVEPVVPSRRSVTSVAKKLGLRDSVLRRWVDKFRQERASAAWRPTMQATPMSADQASEIARLRQENERLRMERDILRSRKIVGWAMRDHMQVELASAALMMAIQQQRPQAGLVHHSDRGVQYASHTYREALTGAASPHR